MIFRIIIPIALCLAPGVCAAGPPNDTAGLLKALNAAKRGAVIRLGPGPYAPIIQDFHGQVTLTSADPKRPATFTSLDVIRSSGLTFDGLDLDNSTFPMGPFGGKHTYSYHIKQSSNITLTNLAIHGDPAGTLDTDRSGFDVRDSDHITVSHSDFHNLHNAFTYLNDTYMTISHNRFHNLRDDAMDGGGVSNFLIENNVCESNHPDGLADIDHPDCIQIWTAYAKAPAHDIIIRDNRYERGTGHATQFIWITDEGHVGAYENVTITGNVAVGSMFNGIGVQHVHNAIITDNVLTSICGPEEGFREMPTMIKTGAMDGLVMKNNRASFIGSIGGDTHVNSAGNVVTACVNRPPR
jgi:hypothetical protein